MLHVRLVSIIPMSPACRRYHRLMDRCSSFTGLVLLFVAAAAPSYPSPSEARVIKDGDQGTEVKLVVGEELTIRLESQPGTGYSWVVSKVDADRLDKGGEPTLEPPDRSLPGAPQHQVFKFKARREGAGSLELAYRRPWEKDTPAAKTFRVTFRIQPAT